MGTIAVGKGDLFKNAPAMTLLVHACNGRGIWGRGIALQFKKEYPIAYADYANWCSQENRVGKSLISGRVGCLVTSKNYGCYADPPQMILKQTKAALDHLMPRLGGFTEIHSPRINAGLFRVPWSETEALIIDAIKDRKGLRWTVWDL